MGARIIGGPLPSITYCGTAYASASASTFTFTGQSISTASNRRFVIVGVVAAGSTINSVTIGGVSATRLDTGDPVGTNAKLFGLLVTSGTTATVVVTMSASVSNTVKIVTWAAYNLVSTTPRADNESLSDPATLNMTVRSRGIAVILATSNLNGATYTISGFSADLTVTSGVGNYPVLAGHVVSVPGGSPLALSVDYSSSAGGPRAVAISLR